MKRFVGVLLQVWAVVCLPHRALTATVFQDGFESGTLGPAWTVSTSNDGRATVTTNYTPATGQWHLVLDDRVSDALYSAAHATLRLDLVNMKNALLTFKAKSLGNEPDPFGIHFGDPDSYDGVAVSNDGGVTWQTAVQLQWLGTDWETFQVNLDFFANAWLGPAFGPDFRIRFSEYDNASAPLDGIAIDDVAVTAEDYQRAVLELPGRVLEGSGPHVGHVLLAFAPANTLTLKLTASPPDLLLLPASVDVPAGQTDVIFNFSVADDHLVNLTRTVIVNATGGGFMAIPAQVINVLDDDAPVATLKLPLQLKEGELTQDNASLSLDRAPDVPLTLSLTASPWNELLFPYTITISPGATQAVFTAQANDDNAIDGDIPVTLTATEPSMLPTIAQTMTVDNEGRTLSLTLPEAVQEAETRDGTVQVSGWLTAPLEVTLTSSDATALSVPRSVTIPVGQVQASFAFTVPDNAIREGNRVVNVLANADTFTGAKAAITIHDNEVASYQFSGLGELVKVSEPVTITVSATDASGNVISGFKGTVNLSLVLGDDTTQPLTPGVVDLSGTAGWTGAVTVPGPEATPLRLRATDGNGNSGDSAPFDVVRVLAVKAADLAWDPKRHRIYASVPSNAAVTNADQVIAIDPVTARITGSVWTGQDPGQIALTSGGEYLYVALNGNGRIARIDPSTLSVTSTFAIGTSPTDGILYAEDISAVAGQPDLLVVAQKRQFAFPRHHGVAVYENGVARPNQTRETAGSNAIEPSADPAIFFGYNNETGEFGFRRLRLDAAGISEIEVKTNLIGDYNADIRSDGNEVFSTSGVELDGAQMMRLGAFSARGPVCPDLAANRVYFVEYRGSAFPPSYGIVAYDPATFAEVNQLALPDLTTLPSQLIRWGTNSLAARSETEILVISSSRLVPSDAPANLAVTVTASPIPAWESAPLTYLVALTNQGPQTARNPILEVTFSDGQALQSVGTTNGITAVSNHTVRVYLEDLPAGAVATLTLTTVPDSAGLLTCSTVATSRAVDPDFADNTTVNIVGAGFQSSVDTVHRIRLTANNLIYDSTRNLLWTSIPAGISPPLGGSVVSIEPTSGLFSHPIRTGADPAPQCMALSTNGRYLYLGLRDAPEVLRLDLSSASPGLRIPLGTNLWGWMDYAEDIEPLAGDGTSFLVVSQGDGAVAVFDGTVPRTNRSALYTADRIERTGAPDSFVGYAGSSGNYKLTRLAVTGAGVSISQSVNNYAPGAREIQGAGNLILFSSGLLADSSSLALIANLGVSGAPCLDLSHARAYLVVGNALRGYDTTTTMATGTFPLPITVNGDWAQSCVRWGPDGFALLGYYDPSIYIVRWSEANSAGADTNGDGFSDSWETTYFGGRTVDPGADNDGDGLRNFQEYVFATSPLEPSSDPLQVSTSMAGGQLLLRLVFPRRAGLVPRPYDYVISSDLDRWAVVPNVSETVLSVQTVGGIQVETVEALIPATNPEMGFLRFRWNPH